MANALLVESPASSSSSRHRQRVLSPLSNGSAGDFELRHWRPAKRGAPPSGVRRRSAPPEIEIPNGGRDDDGHAYTSLRDILSSPKYAASAHALAACGGGSCGDIHMIRHPLVKHAAYAYLQLTPSPIEDSGRRSRRRRHPLCRLLLSCLGFVGALFRR